MEYNVLDFGAVADGVTNNAAAIQRAIDEATIRGGKVIIPSGRFLSGTLTLKSNVELYLETGAVLISSLNPADILDFAKLFSDDNRETGWDGGCFCLPAMKKILQLPEMARFMGSKKICRCHATGRSKQMVGKRRTCFYKCHIPESKICK